MGVNVGIVDASTATNGRKTVTTAGTPVQLTTNAQKLSTGVFVRALSANTGKIYVGFGNTVSASTGFELSAGETLPIEINHADGVWIDASVNGEGVCFLMI
jgi:hypothetical protein